MIGLKNSYEIAYNGTENECRFELYADNAAEMQGVTHFDGIKIQMGSECTDISTGDKYLLNGSGVWVLQPSDRAFSNVYTKAEIDSMVNVIYQIMMYYHTAQESTDGTITFYSFAGFVGSLTIYGNGQQSGTPTPDNPVMPTFCGVRTGNLFDEQYPNISGTIQYIPIYVGDGNFTMSTTTPYELGVANLFLLSGNVESGASTQNNGVWEKKARTVASENGYITVAYRRYNNTTSPADCRTMLSSGQTALPYEPYGYKIPLTCAGQTIPVYLGEVPTVRRVRKLVLTGEEDWEHDGSGAFWTTIATGNTIINRIGLCNAYKLAATSGTIPAVMDNGEFTVLASNERLFIKNTSYGTAAVFKSYLAAQYAAGTPVTVWYILAEPETAIINEPLAKIGDYADELSSTDAGVTIPTVDGENTLTIDTAIAPSKIEISGER